MRNETINHPAHYAQGGAPFECIELVEQLDFCLGNVVKYVWRHEQKGGVEDLKKARWYLHRYGCKNGYWNIFPYDVQRKFEQLAVSNFAGMSMFWAAMAQKFWSALDILDEVIEEMEMGQTDGN